MESVGSRYIKLFRQAKAPVGRGEEQNREEGEIAQKKLGGGRNRGKN